MSVVQAHRAPHEPVDGPLAVPAVQPVSEHQPHVLIAVHASHDEAISHRAPASVSKQPRKPSEKNAAKRITRTAVLGMGSNQVREVGRDSALQR
jgi:hypothetical protein